MMRRLLCLLWTVCLLLVLCGCGSGNLSEDYGSSDEILNTEDVNSFDGQTAPVVMTIPDNVSDVSMGDWVFWDTKDPYLADTVSHTESIGNGFVVTLIQTGFHYSVHEMRNALMSSDSFSDAYVLADALHENHYSNVVQNLGGFTSYIVTSSVNGLLTEHAENGSVHEDYDDLYLALSQDFSAYENPNSIEAQIYVSDLSSDSQAWVYEIIAAVFGPDFAEYLVCGVDQDGLDADNLNVTSGNRDDIVSVGDTDYRFTRTISSKNDGYLVKLTGTVERTPSESNFIYYADGYFDAYASTPMSLAQVLQNDGLEDYASDDFTRTFQTYFLEYSHSPTGYQFTLPLSMSYYELRGADDTVVYSTQMSMYGVGDEVTEDTSKVRRLDAAYMVTLSGDTIYRLMLSLSGQTTTLTSDGKDLTDAERQDLFDSAAESLCYFFGDDIDVSFTPSEDSDDMVSISFDADIYGGSAAVTGVMAITEQDGYRWVDWSVSVSK